MALGADAFGCAGKRPDFGAANRAANGPVDGGDEGTQSSIIDAAVLWDDAGEDDSISGTDTYDTPSLGDADATGSSSATIGSDETAGTDGSAPTGTHDCPFGHGIDAACYTDDISGDGGGGQLGCGTDEPCSADCPCVPGVGVCTNDEDCALGLTCTSDAVKKFGLPEGSQGCMPSHCLNDETDEHLGETNRDCGGDCGCRATYETIPYLGLPSQVDDIYLSEMSGDGRVLVGSVVDDEGVPRSVPVTISETGQVTLLDNLGVNGGASTANVDGTVIAGYLDCQDPPACTDGSSLPYRWDSAQAGPIKFPFGYEVVGMSTTGNIVAYTEYGTDPDRAVRFNVSSGNATYSPDVASARGLSHDGTVVYGSLVEPAWHDGVWYSQTDKVHTPPYPSEWSNALITAMNQDGRIFVGRGLVWLDEANVELFPFVSQDEEFEVLEASSSGISLVEPNDLSADGTRFIGQGMVEASGEREAIIWDEPSGIRRLYDELVARGIEFPIDVTSLTPALFISDDGSTIVGSFSSSFWRVVLADESRQ